MGKTTKQRQVPLVSLLTSLKRTKFIPENTQLQEQTNIWLTIFAHIFYDKNILTLENCFCKKLHGQLNSLKILTFISFPIPGKIVYV